MFPSSPFLGHSFSSGWNIFMLWDNGGFLKDAHMIPWDLLWLWSLFFSRIFQNVLILQLVICTWSGSFIFGNKLLCWENTRLLCVRMHAFGTRWLTCSNKRNEMWRTRTCSQSGRLQVFRTSWCLELLHSKLFPASSKTIVTEIDAQQSANLIRLPGNLQAPALKPVTILLHGLIEWKISFQSSPHPRVAPHHSSSAL